MDGPGGIGTDDGRGGICPETWLGDRGPRSFFTWTPGIRGDSPGWPAILLAMDSCCIGYGLNCPDAAAVAIAAAAC